jgi:hypothetical protein
MWQLPEIAGKPAPEAVLRLVCVAPSGNRIEESFSFVVSGTPLGDVAGQRAATIELDLAPE